MLGCWSNLKKWKTQGLVGSITSKNVGCFNMGVPSNIIKCEGGEPNLKDGVIVR